MSCASRVAVVDLSAAAGTTVTLPTQTDDGYPIASVRVLDSVICTMTDSGSAGDNAVELTTSAGAGAFLKFGKLFAAAESDTFSVHFPHGLPVYDMVDIGGGIYVGGNEQPQTVNDNKLQVSVSSGVSAGKLTIAYHWMARAQLG